MPAWGWLQLCLRRLNLVRGLHGSREARTELAGALSLLRRLFAHGTAEEFSQCGIEGGAGLLLNLL